LARAEISKFFPQGKACLGVPYFGQLIVNGIVVLPPVRIRAK
jgi:hypothetical protein